MNEIARDGGIKSRKFWFSVGAVVVLFAAACVAGWRNWPEYLYRIFVDGVEVIAGGYLVGNVAAKFVGSKVAAEPAPTTVTKKQALTAEEQSERSLILPESEESR